MLYATISLICSIWITLGVKTHKEVTPYTRALIHLLHLSVGGLDFNGDDAIVASSERYSQSNRAWEEFAEMVPDWSGDGVSILRIWKLRITYSIARRYVLVQLAYFPLRCTD